MKYCNKCYKAIPQQWNDIQKRLTAKIDINIYLNEAFLNRCMLCYLECLKISLLNEQKHYNTTMMFYTSNDIIKLCDLFTNDKIYVNIERPYFDGNGIWKLVFDNIDLFVLWSENNGFSVFNGSKLIFSSMNINNVFYFINGVLCK